MNVVLLLKEDFDILNKELKEIKEILLKNQQEPKDEFIDNADFIQLMKISKRTAQTWRDEGKISFSQISGKIYYRMSDVKKLLDDNHNESFKRSRR